jgi:hypothetical protein
VLDLTPLGTAGGQNPQASTATPSSTAQGASPTLSLVQQYVSNDSFATIRGLTADANATVYALGQHASTNEDLMVIGIGSQKTCAS